MRQRTDARPQRLARVLAVTNAERRETVRTRWTQKRRKREGWGGDGAGGSDRLARSGVPSCAHLAQRSASRVRRESGTPSCKPAILSSRIAPSAPSAAPRWRLVHAAAGSASSSASSSRARLRGRAWPFAAPEASARVSVEPHPAHVSESLGSVPFSRPSRPSAVMLKFPPTSSRRNGGGEAVSAACAAPLRARAFGQSRESGRDSRRPGRGGAKSPDV